MDEDPRVDAYLEGHLQAVARRLDSAVLANAVADAPDGRALNLNVLYAPDGRLIGTYAKRHLVPYGEEVPFRKELQRFIHALDQIPRDFAPGHRPGLFEVDGHRIATIICFESAFGYDVRPLVREGRAADRRVDEQPLLPPLGELEAARGAQPDARRGDGAARPPRRHLG